MRESEATLEVTEQKFTAPDMSRAMRLLSTELGPDAILLSSRKVAGGVEIIGLPPGHQQSAGSIQDMHTDRRDIDRRASERRKSDRTAADLSIVERNNMDSDDSLSFLGRDSSRTTNGGVSATENNAVSPASKLAERIGELRAPLKEGRAFEQLQSELKDVKQLLEKRIAGLEPVESTLPNPAQYFVANRMIQMGLPQAIARAIAIESDDVGMSVSEIWAASLEKLKAILPIAPGNMIQPGVTAFIGPAGAGKTATVIKFAAQCVIQNNLDDVAIISLNTRDDNSLRRFSQLSKVPVFYVDTQFSLSERIKQCNKRKWVLIDCGLDGPERGLAELSEMPAINKVMVLPATGEQRWLDSIIKRYQWAGCSRCVLTQYDQAESIGAAISSLLKSDLKIEYLTTGPLLPNDLQAVAAERLMQSLLKSLEVTEGAEVPTVNMHHLESSDSVVS